MQVVGSISHDQIDGSMMPAERRIGGSALYFALAASILTPVRMYAIVGRDSLRQTQEVLAQRPVDTRLQISSQPTYLWSARFSSELGQNVELDSDESIYSEFDVLPEPFDGPTFVGSLPCHLQQRCAERLGGKVDAGDLMPGYIRRAPDAARTFIGMCDWFLCNAIELEALGYSDPWRAINELNVSGLVLKLGAQGLVAHWRGATISMPAYPCQIVDTTGAGDALAAGFICGGGTRADSVGPIAAALALGVALASAAIEGPGIAGIKRVTRARVIERAGWAMGRGEIRVGAT